MSNEEKKSELSTNLAAALNPAKIENPANVDPVTRQEIQKKSLSELKVEIKFHLGQMAGHAIEIGKLLIEAKEQVGHGNFGKWLEDNFNLKYRSARNFMQIAERFGNLQSIADLNYTQMVQMLALPAGEEEKFIAEKAAEGAPIEDMTVKNLKAEIADYKKRLAQAEEDVIGYKRASEIADAQLENLGEENQQIRQGREEDGKRIGELVEENLNLQADKAEMQDKIDDLENELLRKKTETIEVAPADYEPTKKELAETKAENEKLQAELKDLQERPLEVAVEYPADYETLKNENAKLKNGQERYKNLVNAEKNFSQAYSGLQYLCEYTPLPSTLEEMIADKYSYKAEMKQMIGFMTRLTTEINKVLKKENADV